MKYNPNNNQIMQDLQGYFTHTQVRQIIIHAPTKELQLLFKILYHGRRITEVLGRQAYTHKNKNTTTQYPEIKGLTPSSIDHEKCLVSFKILKKKKPTLKLFPLEDSTFNELINYIREQNIKEDEPVFKLNRFQASYQLKKVCKKLGIHRVGAKKPHLHLFRHSFAVHLLERTNDPAAIKIIQNALVHSNINITSGYLQFSQDRLRGLVNKTIGGI
jgi:integrase